MRSTTVGTKVGESVPGGFHAGYLLGALVVGAPDGEPGDHAGYLLGALVVGALVDVIPVGVTVGVPVGMMVGVKVGVGDGKPVAN